MIALLDNTVLSNFALINQTELIQLALGNFAATVEEVFDEYIAGVRLGLLSEQNWDWLDVLALTDLERQTFGELRSYLGAGEAACIAMAVERQYRVLTDDLAGRKTAMQLGCPVSGSIGILIRLVDLDHLTLSQADAVLEEMTAAGYRAPVATLAELF